MTPEQIARLDYQKEEHPLFFLPINNYQPEQEVDYDDATHTYFLGETIYRSATTIVSQFHEKFDSQEKAEWMAYRYGNTPEYWLTQWRTINSTSLVRGNGIHNREEQFLYNRGFTRVTGDREYKVYRTRSSSIKSKADWAISIRQLADGCYPELKLWRHDWAIAGRSDKPTIETFGGKRFVHIEDYKTNKIIQTNGYVDRHGNEKMMYEPLSHLPDCEMTHYAIQLSIYQYLFEYFGFQPGIRRIIHFPHEIPGVGTPNPKPYELPYYRNEVIAMLTTLKLKQWLGVKR